MSQEHYTVLARKYRPQTFDDLVGQDVLVTTLEHAIEQQRFANAYLLTGIRGVGKTSTARIIAKALNCVGEDESATAPRLPCGKCSQCQQITSGSHVDVLEVDAASRTGVDDIREIIDNVQYLPSSGRFKVYIIDEVHMLSKNAFNALLKTLEEPPARVKFIFATTEVRKVPITVLSRCQRFDLPRVTKADLVGHLQSIAEKEQVKAQEEALEVITKLSEGSVRDALSLLDQVIGHEGQDQTITAEAVNNALGLVGKEGIFELYAAIADGNSEQAISLANTLYSQGSDPVLILHDLAEVTHMLSKAKVVKNAATVMELNEGETGFISKHVDASSVPFLARLWQLIQKGLGEMRMAQNSMQALEMIIIRMVFASQLPTPGDLVKKLHEDKTEQVESKVSVEAPAPAPEPAPVSEHTAINSFEDLVNAFKANNEHFIYNWLRNEVYPVSFEPGKVEIRMGQSAPKDLPNKLAMHLKAWTGKRWGVIVSGETGQKTLKQKEHEALEAKKQKIVESDAIQSVLKAFPNAEVLEVYQGQEEQKNAAEEETETAENETVGAKHEHQ